MDQHRAVDGDHAARDRAAQCHLTAADPTVVSGAGVWRLDCRNLRSAGAVRGRSRLCRSGRSTGLSNGQDRSYPIPAADSVSIDRSQAVIIVRHQGGECSRLISRARTRTPP